MMNRISDTVKHLIIINVIMFIGTLTIGNGESFYQWFSLFFPKNDWFKPWQIFTHMFMHGDYMHIIFNMFALWMFGTAVENSLGSKRFLFLYLSAGLGAVLFQLGYSYFSYLPEYNKLIEAGLSDGQITNLLSSASSFQGVDITQTRIFDIFNSRMVGASGCIFGILVAFGMLNPNAELMLIFLPIPIKAKYFIPAIVILDVISAFSGQSFFSPSNTAFMAHVGGAITGFLMMWFWKKNQFNNHRWN